jgi:GcrA cell cycle regulator
MRTPRQFNPLTERHDWNEETIGQLHDYWAEGLSTAEIGRRMGVSKNAVVGKAHRLNLPSRPSPIQRGRTAVAPRVLDESYLKRIAFMVQKTGGAWMATETIAKILKIKPRDVVFAVEGMIKSGEVPAICAREDTSRQRRVKPGDGVHRRDRIRMLPSEVAACNLVVPADAAAAAPAEPVPALIQVMPAAPLPTGGLGDKGCRWPMWGDHQRPTHRFCEQPRAEGHTYCIGHCEEAYPHFGKPKPQANAWLAPPPESPRAPLAA